MYKLQLAIGLVICVLVSSCFDDKISASFDANRDKQGNISGTVSNEDFGVNFMNEMMWGIAGMGPSHLKDAADGRDWLPAGYEPVSSSGGRWVMATGQEFVVKAAKWDVYSQHLSYLVLIQDVRYQYPLGNSGTLYGGLGPYIGYGIGGSSGSGSNKVPAFSSDGYKRFDFGLHFAAGYELPSTLDFRLSYELGLYDKSTDPSDYTSYNRTWSIGVGYSLSKIIGGFKR